ncbi:2,3-diaminopropionate biosynthesis protein SbnB [Amycolatopsis rhizosphaerae]|uniref:2,3-diaminopropionate biosynthesis protein SbnB n=1 Tax=Amycolatopsis rhizosphaerae TaxID=2053003 RepID=A0A558DJF8_9PSEU|nr:2,3-diaminopropionate biosynthesis protein SbnB [Amycolatopsis rhizosphaerae]TVT61144.1 2,3-diaminopropionate biosynthesis protein SbnB [Amycolatopsis rhizosphaerae]
MSGLVPPGMKVITAGEVRKHLEAGREDCVDLVRRAYLAHHRGDSTLPHSSFLRFPHRARDRVIALPGYLGGEFEVAGIKWISSWPGNTGHGLPRASAVMVLNDLATGFPFACLESSLISAARTAASGVLAAELLAGGRTAARVGFVGTGLIADQVSRFLTDLGWRVSGYRLFDLDRAAADRFAARLTARGGTDVEVVEEAGAAFGGCDLVVLATVAGEPHLHDPALLAHSPVVLHLSLRDLAPELILGAQNLTDDADHVLRENTSLDLAARLAGRRDFLDGTIADLIEGRVARDRTRAAVFSPFGLGVLDLAVGQWIHQRCERAGEGRSVPDFHEGTGL